jgi:hypothetical protein
MDNTYSVLAVARMHRAFVKTLRAYFGRPEVLTSAHDEQIYWLGRQLAHEGRIILGESR